MSVTLSVFKALINKYHDNANMKIYSNATDLIVYAVIMSKRH